MHFQLDLPAQATFVSAKVFATHGKTWGECNFKDPYCKPPDATYYGAGHVSFGPLVGPVQVVDHSERYSVNLADNSGAYHYGGVDSRLQLTYTMPGPTCVALDTFRVTARIKTQTTLLIPRDATITGVRTYAREQDNTSSFSLCDDFSGNVMNKCLPPNGPVGRLGFTLISTSDKIDSAQGIVNQCGNDVDSDRECRVEIDYIPQRAAQPDKKLIEWLDQKRTQ